jgi:hypothetical protein
MKKMILVFLFVLSTAVTSFAQNFTVQEVSGRVERNSGSNIWETIKAGDILREDTIIRTGIGAYITVKTGEQVMRVDSSKTGKISDLAVGRSSIQIQGRVSETDTSAVSRNSRRIAVASARASDAAEDAEIVEE